MEYKGIQLAEMKTCSTCKEAKNISEFSRKSERKDGLSSQCEDCIKKGKGKGKEIKRTSEGKECFKCGEFKLYDQFRKRNQAKDGYESQCKACKSIAKPKPITETATEKLCSKCGEWKAFEEFHFRNDVGKYRAECKTCRYKVNEKYKQKNIEEWKEWQKQYQKDNSEHLSNYKKQWVLINAERLKINQHRYYQENKEILLVKNKENYQKNKEYYSRRYEKMKDAWNEQRRQFRQENLEKVRKEEREYQQKNRERFNERQRKRRLINLEKINAQKRAWYKTEKGKETAYRAYLKRRSYKHKVRFIPHERKEILDRDKWRCQHCKIKVHDRSTGNWNTPNKAHIDHIISLVDGGNSEPNNLQTLCRTCNLKKHSKSDKVQLSLF